MLHISKSLQSIQDRVHTHVFLLNSQRKQKQQNKIIIKKTTHTHGKLAAASYAEQEEEEKVISQLPLNRGKAEHQLGAYYAMFSVCVCCAQC